MADPRSAGPKLIGLAPHEEPSELFWTLRVFELFPGVAAACGMDAARLPPDVLGRLLAYVVLREQVVDRAAGMAPR